MRFFVKMNSNFTSMFFRDHGRIVVAETNFKIIASVFNLLKLFIHHVILMGFHVKYFSLLTLLGIVLQLI